MQLGDFFQGTQERARNSGGKRAISVRAIEVLLYKTSRLNHVYLGKQIQTYIHIFY